MFCYDCLVSYRDLEGFDKVIQIYVVPIVKLLKNGAIQIAYQVSYWKLFCVSFNESQLEKLIWNLSILTLNWAFDPLFHIEELHIQSLKIHPKIAL